MKNKIEAYLKVLAAAVEHYYKYATVNPEVLEQQFWYGMVEATRRTMNDLERMLKEAVE